jgi:hypothetical protein
MPAFTLQPEPARFNADVRLKGLQWLANHPNPVGRPCAYWRLVKSDLRKAFNSLCGFSLMHEMRGTVDHFISWKNNRNLAYEWTNYRFASGVVNSSKQNADEAVWDPFEIEFEWLDIHLPSMIMMVRDDAPPDKKGILQDTLDRLPISDEDDVIDYRAEYYNAYKDHDINLAWLERKVPVLANSIRRYEAAHPGEDLP